MNEIDQLKGELFNISGLCHASRELYGPIAVVYTGDFSWFVSGFDEGET